MFRPPNAKWKGQEGRETEADIVLRQGLRRVPVPEVSADFDARVHAALRNPVPWWRPLWSQARPMLATACCSLLATLALLRFGGMAGSQSFAHAVREGNRGTGGGMIAASRARGRLEALDRSIDSADLSTASLQGAPMAPPPSLPPSAPLKQRPKELQRHTAS